MEAFDYNVVAATSSNNNMKKTDIIARLTSMRELTKATEIHASIDALIAELGPVSTVEEGKLACFVTVNERKLDPAQKYPRQMIECHQILAENVELGKTLDRARILELIGEHADRLNTRQSPERIYAFYQKRMEDEGWLTRSKFRI